MSLKKNFTSNEIEPDETMSSTYRHSMFTFGFFLLVAHLHPWHVHPYRTYYHDATMIVGLLLAFATFATNNASRLIFPRILLLPLSLLALLAGQLIFQIALWPHDLLLPALCIAASGLALIVGATIAAQERGSEAICLALALAHLLAGIVSVALQAVQLGGLDASPFVMFIARDAQANLRPYANVAQPNQLALLLCFSLAAVWYLYQRRWLQQFAAAVLAVLLLAGLALTQSRIGWVILPAFALICLSTTSDGRPLSKWLLACMLLLYAALVLGLPELGRLLGFAGGSVSEHVGGRSERRVLWQQAWSMAAQHPWLGVGWGGFGPEQVRIAADFSAGTYAEHAHNLILNFAAELGWPATLLLTGGLAWWLWQTCVAPAQSVTLRFASLCLLAALVHSMVEFPLWYAYVLIPVGLLMGMLHQLRWPAAGLRVTPPAILVTCLLSGLLLVLVTLDYQRVVSGFRSLRWEQQGYAIQRGTLQMPAYTLFPQFFEYFRLMKIEPREGMSASEIAYVEQWSRRFGFVHILNKLAEVYVLNGSPQRASRAMLSLQRLHPFSYAEYYDYWRAKAALDARYAAVFQGMPARDAQ